MTIGRELPTQEWTMPAGGHAMVTAMTPTGVTVRFFDWSAPVGTFDERSAEFYANGTGTYADLGIGWAERKPFIGQIGRYWVMYPDAVLAYFGPVPPWAKRNDSGHAPQKDK